ncbi:phage head closure protein [Faucicola boevrei]|uniref:phage head closure protein n=1 Tax=Faucicola boevrei TaxID=346665 RepID=UPI00037E90B5|nr:phage head closure protein [Moraxella boevrei]
MLQAGKLRNRIKIFKPVTKRSPTGAVKAESWEHILTLWANFQPLSVKDVVNSQMAGSQLTARCVIRYRNDINSSMRVEYQGEIYQIHGEPLPDNATGKVYLTLMLKSI